MKAGGLGDVVDMHEKESHKVAQPMLQTVCMHNNVTVCDNMIANS